MSIHYEVRRGSAVIGPKHADIESARTFAKAHSFPGRGELMVYGIRHEEWPVPETAAEPIPLNKAQRRAS